MNTRITRWLRSRAGLAGGAVGLILFGTLIGGGIAGAGERPAAPAVMGVAPSQHAALHDFFIGFHNRLMGPCVVRAVPEG